MSVGKGSIQRAAKAKGAAEKKEAVEEAQVVEKKEVIEEAAVAEKKETAKEAPKKAVSAKTTAKKKAAPAKKAVKKTAEEKKDPVVAVSVIASDDIHEKKFEAVSHIYCELPTYLL